MSNYCRKWEPVRSADVKRVRLTGMVFSVLVVLILFRAFSFQVLKREPWRSMAPTQHQNWMKLTANRGVIYDRNMAILAMDYPIASLAVDPSRITDHAFTAARLAEVLDGETETYFELLDKNRNKSFVMIDKEVTDIQKKRILESVTNGIIPLKGRKRIRPYQSLAPQVIGVANSAHQGVGGIEQAMNDELEGEDGWAIYQRDGLNRNFSSPDYPMKNPRDGNHVVVTLDQACQTILEEELKKGAELHGAKSGTAVLMDPFSGEVLAMASVLGKRLGEDRFDFNTAIQNRAVQVAFEPGSTFKIVTTAAVLEERLFESGSLIHCENGEYTLYGHPIHDHNDAYGFLTLSQVIEKSSNIGIVKVGLKLGEKKLYRYARDFGFGTRTDINLPGETTGTLRPVYQWVDFSTAAISFGQGFSASCIQLACMVSVVANGGELVKPMIYRSVIDPSGKEIKQYSKQVIRRVISEKTARELRSILERVVTEGGGDLAAVEGVRVAGKTGTAQKSLPGFKGYTPGAYISSFAGFWPAEAPMYVLVVVLDEPVKLYWGSKSAAPVFARIVSRIVGIPPSPTVPESDMKNKSINRFVYSNITGADETDRGGRSTDMKPLSQNSPNHIPRLTGLSVREALQKLSVRGVETRVEGSGVVIAQDPSPGEKITKGLICYLKCRDQDS